MKRDTNRSRVDAAAEAGTLETTPTGSGTIFCTGLEHFSSPDDIRGACFYDGRCTCGPGGMTRLPAASGMPDPRARAAGD